MSMPMARPPSLRSALQAMCLSLSATGPTGEKTDVTEGTYPEGSAWRKEGSIGLDDGIWNDRIYKDHVRIPCDLEPGQYVLSWRWDAMTAPQIWSSCANIEIV